jgi:hypothetical protein
VASERGRHGHPALAMVEPHCLDPEAIVCQHWGMMTVYVFVTDLLLT